MRAGGRERKSERNNFTSKQIQLASELEKAIYKESKKWSKIVLKVKKYEQRSNM